MGITGCGENRSQQGSASRSAIYAKSSDFIYSHNQQPAYQISNNAEAQLRLDNNKQSAYQTNNYAGPYGKPYTNNQKPGRSQPTQFRLEITRRLASTKITSWKRSIPAR